MRCNALSVSSVALLSGALSLPASAQTPYLVKDLNPAGEGLSTPVGATGDRLVFVGTDGSPGGQGLWSTDGTDASTQLLRRGLVLDFWTSFELGDALVGSAWLEPDGLWRTDGSVEGTRKISAVASSETISPFYIHPDVEQGGMSAFYGTYPGDLHPVPFVTDGTAQGTVAIPYPVGVTTATGFAAWRPITIDKFRGGFAIAQASGESPERGVWLYDPSAHRTVRLQVPGYSDPDYAANLTLRAVDERLFVHCYDLCVTDGTASGTHVIDVPGFVSPYTRMEALNGSLYFWMFETANSSLWRSDGTAAGTVPLASIAPVLQGLTFLHGSAMVSGSVLYFAAKNPATGLELWRTDGTARGTFLLKDIDPGPGSGLPEGCLGTPDCTVLSFVPAAGGLIFWAGNPATGFEAWKTDGTTAGTVPLPEIAPGPASSKGSLLFRAGSRVYFGADDGVHGRELWAIDLPPGAVAVDDAGAVSEGDGPGTSVRFTVSLESPAPQPVVVSYTTVAGTAQAGSDFVPKAGTLTFAPGARQAFVDVSIVADDTNERPESSVLAVTTVDGAPIADGRGVAVILDDDGPRITVADASVVEGDSGRANASFAVTLTTDDGQPTTDVVTLRADADFGTATAADFPSPQPPLPPLPIPTVTFPAGTASGTTLALLVPVQGDTLEEPNETFSLQLDAGNDAALPDAAPSGVIVDDDGIDARPPVEIAHGSRIVADLTPPVGRASDVDFYLLRHDLHASYEVVLDGISGDAAPITLERVVADGGVFQVGTATGTGTSVSLRFFGLGTSGEHLRVRSDACGTACGTDDIYRLRMYETTLRAPRVNTTGTQATAIVLQNTTDRPVQAIAAFWSEGGVLSGLHLLNAVPHGTTVLDVRTVVPQFAGSLTVGHDAPYGTLVGKVVTFDPETGFAFDTPLTAKPR
jgi:ELWxxDGT repeat protein